METQLLNLTIKNVACDALIIGVTRSRKMQEKHTIVLSSATGEVDQLLDGLITSMYNNGEFKANTGETAQIYTMGKLAARRVIVVGLGNIETLDRHAFRRAAGIAVRLAQSKGAHTLALALEPDDAEGFQAMVEGALLGLYHFNTYLTSQTNGQGIESLQFLSKKAEDGKLQAAFQRGLIMAEATNFARDMVNEQPAVLTPTEFARRASSMAQRFKLECTILERAQMLDLGMGGLLAVSKGSAEPPSFIVLRYRGAPHDSAQEIALVGKGITFDSGGISIKPAAGMENMKADMAGGAAVIGAMQIIAALKPEINVLGLIPSSENMADGASYRPGDIVRLMNGKTIEIVNTDAEGRMVLADGLSYAVKEGCSLIIDIATLTGGCVVALGGKRGALFSNDKDLSASLMATSQFTGEKFWPMPLDDEYLDFIDSHVADMKQSGGRLASPVTAAKILEHFVGETRWAHLDIAGMEFTEGKSAFTEPGASGIGVRALATFVLQQAEKKR